MGKVLILVEGQTEEKFVKKLLGPHLQAFHEGNAYAVEIIDYH
jgi:hypothetical protein